jgi:hypothetical protein
MSTLVYNIGFRPVRIGWCVRNGDMEALIKAFRLSHCLWGGRYNPIIVVDDEPHARWMVDLFHVDTLYATSNDEKSKTFAKGIKHLPSPTFGEEGLFTSGGRRKECNYLDVYHPVRLFFERFVKDKPALKKPGRFYDWEKNDPCVAAFEAMFGTYPTRQETGSDYAPFVLKHTGMTQVKLNTGDPVERVASKVVTPNLITTIDLKPELTAEYYEAGAFVGRVDSFTNLVEFWNLRAANVDLFFFDPRFADRLSPPIEEQADFVRSLSPRPQRRPHQLGVWIAEKVDEKELKRFNAPLLLREVDEHTWDDRVWKGLKVNPPMMQLSEHDTVAQISEGERRPTVTVQVGDKPGFNERPFNHQRLVFTLHPTLNYSRDDRFLFKVPFIPELNEHFGREHHLHWNEARAEKAGLGIITDLGREHITLFGMERISLGKQLFKTFGIEAEVSPAGLVCDQLIRQMGGVQGCRVFKIRGVRNLIEDFAPTQSFMRSDALRRIGNVDPLTGKADFSAYEHLYLEPRDKEALKPDDAFVYLLKQGVLRVGLNLRCNSCQLTFWRALDDVKTSVICDYCGRDFNVLPQLKDRDWAYRPSGLFGRADHQEGGIPVVLTLQQLDATMRSSAILSLPAMRLAPITANIENCETDFVLVCQDWHGRIELIIGECKANGEISEDDVRKLSKVADAFPIERFDVFIVFSKTGRFTPEEVARCRKADRPDRKRTVLLSERELEPFFPYETAAKEFAIHESCIRMENMVEATEGIYFEPRPKAPKVSKNGD